MLWLLLRKIFIGVQYYDMGMERDLLENSGSLR